MDWTRTVLYVAVVLLALVLLFWVCNLLRVLKGKESSMLFSRLMYLTAIVAVVLLAVRSGAVYTEKTMLAADIVVLVCICVSYARLERTHKYGEPETPEDDEP